MSKESKEKREPTHYICTGCGGSTSCYPRSGHDLCNRPASEPCFCDQKETVESKS